MPKHQKKTAKSRRTKHVRKNKQRRTNRKYKGGGCGCANKPLFGGSGVASYQPTAYQYKLNDLNNDPSNLPNIQASRQLPNITGGKNRNRTYKRNRKMRGGADLLLGANTMLDPVKNFATTTGAYSGINILSGANNLNPAPYSQPIGSLYGNHNAPLV